MWDQAYCLVPHRKTDQGSHETDFAFVFIATAVPQFLGYRVCPGTNSPALSAARPVLQSEAVHIATALDHLTVLEFGEPVTKAAAGSPAFTIEWRDNKVLIKPLKPGVSTDLFVWTASRRFTYELDLREK